MIIIRLDDACHTMNVRKWQEVENILDYYGVKPIVGVIPDNKYAKISRLQSCEDFWDIVYKWQEKGWSIGLHGLHHVNKFNKNTEFLGACLDEQKKKIRKAISIFKKNNINPTVFCAPGHYFDKDTILSLKCCSDIRIICEGTFYKPYVQSDFLFIPVIFSSCRNIQLLEFKTICLHPSCMNENDILKLKLYLSKNSTEVKSVNEIKNLYNFRYSYFDKVFSILLFLLKRLKNRCL